MKIKNFLLKPWVLIIISAVFSALPFTFANLFLIFTFLPSYQSFIPENAIVSMTLLCVITKNIIGGIIRINATAAAAP